MSETFYAIANGKNQLLSTMSQLGLPHHRVVWLDEHIAGDCILYVDYEIHAEEIIKEENLSDARIIPCYDSDGRGSVHHIFEQEK